MYQKRTPIPKTILKEQPLFLLENLRSSDFSWKLQPFKTWRFSSSSFLFSFSSSVFQQSEIVGEWVRVREREEEFNVNESHLYLGGSIKKHDFVTEEILYFFFSLILSISLYFSISFSFLLYFFLSPSSTKITFHFLLLENL